LDLLEYSVLECVAKPVDILQRLCAPLNPPLVLCSSEIQNAEPSGAELHGFVRAASFPLPCGRGGQQSPDGRLSSLLCRLVAGRLRSRLLDIPPLVPDI